MKLFLTGLFLVTPTVFFRVDWLHQHEAKRPVSPPVLSSKAAGAMHTIPVEVITSGSAPQWIQVRVGQ
jgi:hypothetical protein